MKNNFYPLVSLIIPIYNESRYIIESLTAVLAQDYPFDCLEILIVDGMSNDGTRELIQQQGREHPNIYLLDNPQKFVPFALNRALLSAKGDVIIRLDGHTYIAPNYVSECVIALERSCASNVGGRMNAVGEGSFGEAVAIATSSPFGVGGARFHYSNREEWVDTVYMGAWKREVFEKIGLFDEELVRDQDDEFNYRLREQGGKILLSPKIKSVYTVRGTPNKLWTQYYQYGYWKVRVLQKHPRQMSLRQFVPPLFSFSLFLTTLFAFISPFVVPNLQWLYSLSPIPLFLMLGTYILANLTASVITASKKGWRHLPLLPLVFSILHMSYGLGFLVGLVKFWSRWGDKVGKVPQWSTAQPREEFVTN